MVVKWQRKQGMGFLLRSRNGEKVCAADFQIPQSHLFREIQLIQLIQLFPLTHSENKALWCANDIKWVVDKSHHWDSSRMQLLFSLFPFTQFLYFTFLSLAWKRKLKEHFSWTFFWKQPVLGCCTIELCSSRPKSNRKLTPTGLVPEHFLFISMYIG